VGNGSPCTGVETSAKSEFSHHSLENYRRSSTAQSGGRLPSCPNKPYFFIVDTATGESTPARCGRNSCPPCARVNAYKVGLAVGLARPEWAIHITQVGDRWSTIQRRVNRTLEILRDRGYDIVMGWFVEANPKGDGHHVHGYARGDEVAYDTWQATASSASVGSINVQRRVASTEPVFYGVKTVLRGSDDDVRAFLTRNGGRLVHASRAFWRDREGRTTSLRHAMRDPGPHRGRWVFTRIGSDDAVGPTALLLLRHLATRFEQTPDGVELRVAETSQALGVGNREGSSSPILRTLGRLEQFGVACADPLSPTIAVRRNLPPVTRRHLGRLPMPIQRQHARLAEVRLGDPPHAEARRRARRLALVLHEQGDDDNQVERALGSIGFHPAICHDAARWALARRREAASEAPLAV
jgi:hypothetical protein